NENMTEVGHLLEWACQYSWNLAYTRWLELLANATRASEYRLGSTNTGKPIQGGVLPPSYSRWVRVGSTAVGNSIRSRPESQLSPHWRPLPSCCHQGRRPSLCTVPPFV